MVLEDLLRRNQEWAAAQVAADPQFFARQIAGQQPRLLWIGCSDSRVPAEQILACGPGELFIHRNVANIVAYNDINMAAVVQFATEVLEVPDIVICGHYGCGGVAAACEHKATRGYIGDWLFIMDGARREVEARVEQTGQALSPEEFLRQVVEANVKLQIEHLRHLSVIRESWERTPGKPRLHGWVYDIATGLVKVVQT